VVVGAGNGLADYDVIARPLDKMNDEILPESDEPPSFRFQRLAVLSSDHQAKLYWVGVWFERSKEAT